MIQIGRACIKLYHKNSGKKYLQPEINPYSVSLFGVGNAQRNVSQGDFTRRFHKGISQGDLTKRSTTEIFNGSTLLKRVLYHLLLQVQKLSRVLQERLPA